MKKIDIIMLINFTLISFLLVGCTQSEGAVKAENLAKEFIVKSLEGKKTIAEQAGNDEAIKAWSDTINSIKVAKSINCVYPDNPEEISNIYLVKITYGKNIVDYVKINGNTMSVTEVISNPKSYNPTFKESELMKC